LFHPALSSAPTVPARRSSSADSALALTHSTLS
jgi:hypothetical protein